MDQAYPEAAPNLQVFQMFMTSPLRALQQRSIVPFQTSACRIRAVGQVPGPLFAEMQNALTADPGDASFC